LNDVLIPRSAPAAEAPRLPLILSGAWTMDGVIIYLPAPRAAPLVLLLSAVAPTLWHWAAMGRLSWHKADRDHPAARRGRRLSPHQWHLVARPPFGLRRDRLLSVVRRRHQRDHRRTAGNAAAGAGAAAGAPAAS